jgi:GntR family transcriptional regulator
MGARPVDRGNGPPLWSQVRSDLRRRAGRGEFDRQFPGENALVAEYEVSRTTVREALRALRAEGLVSAERGRTPRLVHGREITQPVGAIYGLFASVRAAGLTQRSIVRRLEVQADGVVAARLQLEESTPLVHLERLRLAGEEPLAVDRVWLPAALALPLLEVDFTNTSLYDELAARVGVRLEGGEENIRAVLPSAAERSVLACDPTTAAFAIERIGRVGARAVEWRQTLVRGDRFVFRADFSATGYRLAVASPSDRDEAPVSP